MKLNVSLFKKGDIDKAIRAVEKYQKSLVDRCEVFVRRLTDLGINVAMMTLATKGVGDAPRSAQFFINFTVGEDEVEGILSVTSTPQYDKDGNEIKDPRDEITTRDIIDVSRWFLEKRNKEEYGTRVEITGADGTPLQSGSGVSEMIMLRRRVKALSDAAHKEKAKNGNNGNS